MTIDELTTNEAEISRANREHDLKYGWSMNLPQLYTRQTCPSACSAAPGINKRRRNPELDKIVWEWHRPDNVIEIEAIASELVRTANPDYLRKQPVRMGFGR